MSNALPPNPSQFRDTQQWAQQLYQFMVAESRIKVDNDPVPILLPHQTDGVMERAGQAGVLMYDPVLKAVVYSEDDVWYPLSKGQGMEQLDAFGRLRVSNPETIFDSQLQYDTQPLLWVEKLVSGGTVTHLPDESAADLTVPTTSGASVIRQTREFFRYQPGKSQQIFCTGVLGELQANTNKLVGYGETKNGVFFGQDGGGTYVLLRSNSTGSISDARKVYQADWDTDALDGNGASRKTADWTKAQIFTIDLEWLGVGQVRMGVVIEGQLITVHTFKNANTQVTTYMTTANLPARYEITNTAVTAAPATLKQICTQVTTEGGASNLQSFPFSRGANTVAIPNGAANAQMLFAQRHKLTFNGIENRGRFSPLRYEVNATGGTVYSEVHYTPILDGTETWTSDGPFSIMESSQDVGQGFTNGFVIESAAAAAGGGRATGNSESRGLSNRLPFGLDIDGANAVVIGVTFYALTNNVTADISFHWEEVR